MKPLAPGDIPTPAVFEAARRELRARIIAHKAQRRVAIGENVTLLFEDRETLRWQVLEMRRAEGAHSASSLQHELDVYNELMPGERELSATLFIEITELANIRPELDRLVGLDEHVQMRIGESALRARFDEKQLEADRLSAVQYIRFSLDAAQVRAFGDPDIPATLATTHPAYRNEATLTSELRAALARDFEGGCSPLLDFAKFAPVTQEMRSQELLRAAEANAMEARRLFDIAPDSVEDKAFELMNAVVNAEAQARAFNARARRAARLKKDPKSAAHFEASATEHINAGAARLAELGELCERSD